MKRTRTWVISKEDALSWGVTGPTLRGIGVKYDVRKAFPYSGYEEFDFDIPIGSVGMSTIGTSCVCERWNGRMPLWNRHWNGCPRAHHRERSRITLPSKEDVVTDIAALIRQFKIVSEGFQPPKGEVYASVEASKGELGFYIVSDGSNRPSDSGFGPLLSPT